MIIQKFQYLFFSLIFILFINQSHAQGERFLLTNAYSRVFIHKNTILDNSWIKYPAYKERAEWEKIPKGIRERKIQAGEAYLGYDWPSIKATDYLEFTRTGDRAIVDNPLHEASSVLSTLFMAEIVEGEGRFLDDIVNGVFSFCERTYWGSSAHFYLYDNNAAASEPTTILPDADHPIIDLNVGEIGVKLSWIYYFLHEEFDKISPLISKRLKDEIMEKVLNPYYERNDFWWMWGRAGSGNVNNWNPDCNYHSLLCILLVEDDPVKREYGIYKSMSSVDIFINQYPQDGSCSEGPGYWRRAVGNMFNYLELLNKISEGKVDIFDNEKVREMGRYIYRAYISNGINYTNYADASARISYSPEFIYRIGTMINDPAMRSFAAFLLKGSNDGEILERGVSLNDLFNPIDWKNVTPVEPLISEFYFPDWDVVIGRDKKGTNSGFYFTAKGGSNGEQHNHNDVGSFMLYYNGDPVFIDLGVGSYTRETFSPQRYNIWTMQSNYHNLPVINGQGQFKGGEHRATGSKYSATKSSVSYITDIADAYTEEAKVKSWKRSYLLERGKRFLITDNFQLDANNGGNTINFMTALPCKVVKPGIIELQGDGFTLQLKYNAALLKERIEEMDIEDEKLARSTGDKIARLVFEIKGNNLSGNLQFEVVKQ